MQLSQVVNDDELMGRIVRELRELWDLLIDGGELYCVTPLNNQTLDSNRRLYLPDDYYKLLGIDYNLNGFWVRLDPIPFDNRNQYRFAFNLPAGYQLLGERAEPPGRLVNYLQILPAEAAPQSTYRVYYAPKPLVPVNRTDKIDGINGYERFITTSLSAYMLKKQNILEMAELFLQERESIRARLLEMAAKRNLGQPNHVTVKTPWSRSIWPYPILPRN